MKGLKELFWDSSLPVLDNLATWALGVICFMGFYAVLFLIFLLA